MCPLLYGKGYPNPTLGRSRVTGTEAHLYVLTSLCSGIPERCVGGQSFHPVCMKIRSVCRWEPGQALGKET